MLLRYGFWICLLCMIPGLLIRIPVGGAGILLLDLILPAYIAYWLFLQVFVQRSIPKTSFLFPGMIFIFIAIISWIFHAWELALKEQVLSFSYIIRFFTLLCFGVIAKQLYADKSTLFLRNLWWIIFTIIALGYLQFYIIPDISNFSTVGGFDPHIGRFLGTWMDPNFIAGLLGFFLPIMIGQWYGQQKKNWWLTLLILLSIYAVFLTFSRSGYLAVGFGLGIFFLLRDPKVILIAVLIAILGISINPRAQKRVGELGGTLSNVILQETDEIDPTASLRIQSWSRTLELWQKYPFLGIGYNTYRYKAAEEGIVEEDYFSAGGSDSSLLTILVTTGIVGFLVFAWWYGTLLFKAWKGFWKPRKNKRELYLGTFAGLCSILLHSVFVNSLLFPLILIGIVGVMGVLEEN